LTLPDGHHVLRIHRCGKIEMRASTKTSWVILSIATSGCVSANQPPPAPPPAPLSVSFDGTYTGTITSSSVSGNPAQANWCDTPPQISLSVHNNIFSYHLARPKRPQGMSLNLNAIVGPDGTISGSAANGAAQMDGLVAASQMSGHINGSACSYAFTAQRI
jgi:hypothetical protein